MHRLNMKISLELACLVFPLALSFTLAASPPASTNTSVRCPMDLNFVRIIQWNSSVCLNFHPNSTSRAEIGDQNCCQYLLFVFGIGLAQHLRATSLFQLPNLPTSVSCLQDFQTQLNSLSLPSNLVSLCFEPMQFVITPDLCANIVTTQDWDAKLGESTALDQSCKADLSDLTACETCYQAATQLNIRLVAIDGNQTHATDCYYFIVLYAAGIVNEFGPESVGVVTCAFQLSYYNTISQPSSAGKRNSAIVFGLTGAGIAIFVTLSLLGLYFWYVKGYCASIFSLGSIWFIPWKKNLKGNKLDHIVGDEFRDGMAARKFSLVQLAKVTNNFKGEKLGEGGFGAVYRGYLRELDTYIAVKRISKASKQGIKEYASEVKIISRLRHKNLINLIGWCHEKGELLLVYEFMANGSLDSHLFKGKSLLTWDVRYKIVQGLASALSYLHEEGDHCVLHRDIKTSNVMLDSSFNAKLGDFGLARLVDHAKGSQTTHLAGTVGYMAPECVFSRKFNKESDVYSFGIVALEIACGRRSVEPTYEESRALLVDWVWDSYGNQSLLDVADEKLNGDFNAKQIECLLIVGLWCVHPDPNLRPSIRQAIQVLNFESPLPKLPGTRPSPTYGVVPIASGIKASEPCISNWSITVPR
ncbi:hypothetical protein PTKIN_Ptkin10aG0111100 [Pterospermum kingtungense]